MLKHMIINGKKVPLPVPIKLGSELLGWLSEDYLRRDECITRFLVNQTDCLDDPNLDTLELTESTEVDVRVESPAELLIHTLESARNLTSFVGNLLKAFAVKVWQTEENLSKSAEYSDLMDDLDIVIELLDHGNGLLVDAEQRNAVLRGRNDVSKCISKIKNHCEKAENKDLAKVLLNELEPVLLAVCDLTSDLQDDVYKSTSKVMLGVG